MNKTNKKTKKTAQAVAIKPTKKTTNLLAKAKKTTALTVVKQKELQKLVSAYQQVGISLTKLLQATK